MALNFKKTDFTGDFIRENGLCEDGFKEWVLHQGMLFKSTDKWWGDRGRRSTLHEGLDLCLYRNHQGKIYHITEGMHIPLLYEGSVVGIINDFIGESILVRHYQDSGRKEFCTMYGHAIPKEDMCIGRVVRAGEIIARVAGIREPKSGMCPHIHLSIGIPATGEISYDVLGWKDIGDSNKMTLIDPLQVIDRYCFQPID